MSVYVCAWFAFECVCVCVLLQLFQISVYSSGYFPPKFMKTAHLPIFKNKTGTIANVSSYRPTTLANIGTTIFQTVLLK